MTRQCEDCDAALPDEGRSPRCPRCWTEHQKRRNRAKVQEFRERQRAYHPEPEVSQERHRPTEQDIEWLDGLGLGLAEPVWEIVELLKMGRQENDPDILAWARIVLERYDSDRAKYEELARLQADPRGLAGEWRGFFEACRGLLR